jgi:hypothetical protein
LCKWAGWGLRALGLGDGVKACFAGRAFVDIGRDAVVVAGDAERGVGEEGVEDDSSLCNSSTGEQGNVCEGAHDD